MPAKTFTAVTLTGSVLAPLAAAVAIIGAIKTGFYPGFIILLVTAMIPLASRLYAKRNSGHPDNVHHNRYPMLTILNVIAIFIMLWMTFVITHDRILQDCC